MTWFFFTVIFMGVLALIFEIDGRENLRAYMITLFIIFTLYYNFISKLISFNTFSLCLSIYWLIVMLYMINELFFTVIVITLCCNYIYLKKSSIDTELSFLITSYLLFLNILEICVTIILFTKFDKIFINKNIDWVKPIKCFVYFIVLGFFQFLSDSFCFILCIFLGFFGFLVGFILGIIRLFCQKFVDFLFTNLFMVILLLFGLNIIIFWF